jgi:hypothetical protein
MVMPPPATGHRFALALGLAHTVYTYIYVLGLARAVVADAAAAGGSLRRLSVESRRQPHDIGVAVPTFSWEIVHPGRDIMQVGFTLTVRGAGYAGAAAVRAETSNRSIFVPLPDGLALESDAEYHWAVVVDLQQGEQLAANSSFSTALLMPTDWRRSEWVVAEPGWTASQMRKEFSVPQGDLRRARLFAAVPGYGRILLNGQHVDGDAGTRTMTQFDRSVRYHTFDVTSNLVTGGPNVLGLHLGRGAYGRYNYGPPAARLLLRMSYGSSNSSVVVVGTDGSWMQHLSPFVMNDEFQGVIYDSTKETLGWASVGFQQSDSWRPVCIGSQSTTTPGIDFKLSHTRLLAAQAPAVEVMHRLSPLQVSSPAAGVAVFDMGQNIAGWVRLSISGQRGARVQLRHAEILTHTPYGIADGGIDLDGLSPTANQTDVYVLSGNPAGEIFEPWMTQHGFRYVECTLLSGEVDVWPPTLDSLEALAVRSSVKQSGSLSFGDELANKIQSAVLWGQADNLMMVRTPSPFSEHRRANNSEHRRAKWSHATLTVDFRATCQVPTGCDQRRYAIACCLGVRMDCVAFDGRCNRNG